MISDPRRPDHPPEPNHRRATRRAAVVFAATITAVGACASQDESPPTTSGASATTVTEMTAATELTLSDDERAWCHEWLPYVVRVGVDEGFASFERFREIEMDQLIAQIEEGTGLSDPSVMVTFSDAVVAAMLDWAVPPGEQEFAEACQTAYQAEQ